MAAQNVLSFDAYVKATILQCLAENDKATIIAARTHDASIIEKVESFRKTKLTEEERATFSIDMILIDIVRSACFRAWFRKDPIKQNVYEKCQTEWIRRHMYSDIRKLKAGRGGTYLLRGELMTEPARDASATKTFDLWSPSANVYMVLKYTSESGGAQDNQFADVKYFAREMVANIHRAIGTHSFAICLDGNYYTEKKIAELRTLIPTDCAKRLRVISAASLGGEQVLHN